VVLGGVVLGGRASWPPERPSWLGLLFDPACHNYQHTTFKTNYHTKDNTRAPRRREKERETIVGSRC